jgi:hypothetical protein
VLGMVGIEEENVVGDGFPFGAVLGTPVFRRGRVIFGLKGVLILLRDTPRGAPLAIPGENEKVVGGV